MVICKYFLQGRCLYGAQCRNEHTYENRLPNVYGTPQKSVSFGGSTAGAGSSPLNYTTLKRAVDEEIRLTQGGKQWPFSCFCPLKEGGNIPEFNDISPEELRSDAYDAQNQNNFETYKNKFELLKKEYEDKSIRLINLDVKGLENLFSGGTFGGTSLSVFGSKNTQTLNPFQSSSSVFGSNVSSSTKPFGQASLFSQTTPSKSMFGTSTPSTPSTGLFSSAAPTAQPSFSQTASVFTQNNSFGQSSNVFGQQLSTAPLFSQTQPAGTIFSQNTQQPQQQSVFAQASQILFSQQQAQQGQCAGVFGQNSKFGQQTSSGQANLFGQTAQPVGLFSQPPAFGQQPAAPQGADLFGQAPSSAASNIFGQSSSTITNAGSLCGQKPAFGQQTNLFVQSGNSIFGQAAPTSTSSSGKILFTQATPAASSNLFGQIDAAQHAPPTFGQPGGGSLFGQAATPSASTPTTFGQAPNLFGSSTFAPSTSQPTPPSGLFASAAQPPSHAFGSTPDFGQQAGSGPTPSPFSSITAFGARTPPQTSAPLYGSKSFAPIQEQSSGSYAQSEAPKINPFTQVPSGNHFSTLEELEDSKLEAFKADCFVLGVIPVMPPPRELCFGF